MNLNIRRVLSIAGILVILIASSILFPRIYALALQIQGGQMLEQSLRTADDIPKDSIICSEGATTNSRGLALLNQAVDKLEKSLAQNEELSQAHLLLGRAYCLLGKPQEAVLAYEKFVSLRPNNPLGHLELGFALESLCREQSLDISQSQTLIQKGTCTNPEIRSKITNEWEMAQVVKGFFIQEARAAFNQEEMQSSLRWFDRGSLLSDSIISNEDIFKWYVSSVINDQRLPPVKADFIHIYPVTDSQHIEAEELYWIVETSKEGLTYSGQLRDFPIQDTNYGVMWWKGRAVAFIDVEDAGIYEISIRAIVRLKQPLPGQIMIQFEKNFSPIEELDLTSETEKFTVIKTATILQPGPQLIDIRFLEDNGDIVLDWLQIKKLQPLQ